MRLGKDAVKLYLKGLDLPVPVVRKACNEDGSTGIFYLATSDPVLTYEQVILFTKDGGE